MKICRLLALLAASAAFVVSCAEEGYLIEGDAGLSDGKAVLMYKTPDGAAVSDTVSLKNGHFRFKGQVSDVVRGTLAVIPEDGQAFASTIFIENAHVQVTLDPSSAVDDGMFGDMASIYEPKYAGGPNNAFFAEFSALGADREARKQLIAASKDVEAAALFTRMYFSDAPLEVYDSVFTGFSPKVQDSFLAREAKEELMARKRVAPGCIAPDFTLKDIDGNDVTLSSLRGRYVLLDFWASWCVPCREGIPELKTLYAKYHDKGLEILGVTNDSNEADWKEAVAQDGTPWIHVKDEFPVKGRPARVVSEYAVHSIPAFFLIDKEGVILGQPDHGQLPELLSSIFD